MDFGETYKERFSDAYKASMRDFVSALCKEYLLLKIPFFALNNGAPH